MKIFTKTMFIAVFALFTQNASGQTHQKGDILLNPSITLGWYEYGYGLNRVSVVPPVGLNFEYHLSDIFGFGLEGTYMSRKYKNFTPTSFDYDYKYSYQAVSARLSFHYLDLLRKWFSEELSGGSFDNVDLYLTASAGYQWVNTTETWLSGNAGSNRNESRYFESSYISNFAAGARYYVSDNFGVFAEGGRNTFGWVKIGATLKF